MSSLCIHGFVSAGAPPALEASGLHLVAEAGIAAIVGEAPACGFQGLAREQAVGLLLQHQQALEAVMARTTVLPVKFGTLAPDEAGLRRMLAQGSAMIGAQLAEFSGRLQMEIVVLWPLDKVFAEIAADPDIAELRARAQETGAPADGVQLGEAVKTALERRRAALAGGIGIALREVAIDVADNALMNDRMVANIALLMNKSDLGRLEATLERLDAETDGVLTFRSIGPLPPANFATVEVSFPPRETIESARRTLELGGEADQSDIKAAYYRLARACHPDTASADGADARMGELAQAYRFLMACAKARMASSEDGIWRLAGDTADDIVLIDIVRQDVSGGVSGCTA
jgi:hypothetical protein